MPLVGAAEHGGVGFELAVGGPDRPVVKPEVFAQSEFRDLREKPCVRAELGGEDTYRVDDGEVGVELLPAGDSGGFRGTQELFGRRVGGIASRAATIAAAALSNCGRRLSRSSSAAPSA